MRLIIRPKEEKNCKLLSSRRIFCDGGGSEKSRLLLRVCVVVVTLVVWMCLTGGIAHSSSLSRIGLYQRLTLCFSTVSSRQMRAL